MARPKPTPFTQKGSVFASFSVAREVVLKASPTWEESRDMITTVRNVDPVKILTRRELACVLDDLEVDNRLGGNAVVIEPSASPGITGMRAEHVVFGRVAGVGTSM